MNELDAKHAEYWERECVRSIMSQVANATRLLHEISLFSPEDADNAEWGGQLTAAMIREFGDSVKGHEFCRGGLMKLSEVIEDSLDGNTFAGG